MPRSIAIGSSAAATCAARPRRARTARSRGSSVPDSSRDSSSRSPTSSAIEPTIARLRSQEFALDVRVVDLAVEDQLEIAAQAGQRRPELVGDGRDESVAARRRAPAASASSRSAASWAVTSARATAAWRAMPAAGVASSRAASAAPANSKPRTSPAERRHRDRAYVDGAGRRPASRLAPDARRAVTQASGAVADAVVTTDTIAGRAGGALGARARGASRPARRRAPRAAGRVLVRRDGDRGAALGAVGETAARRAPDGPGEQAQAGRRAAPRRARRRRATSSARARSDVSSWARRSSARRKATRRSADGRRRRDAGRGDRPSRQRGRPGAWFEHRSPGRASSGLERWRPTGRSPIPRGARRPDDIPRRSPRAGRKYRPARGEPASGRAAAPADRRPSVRRTTSMTSSTYCVGLAPLGGGPDAALDVVLEDEDRERRRRRPAAPRSAGGCRRSTPRARSSGRCRGPGPPSATGGGRGPALSFE